MKCEIRARRFRRWQLSIERGDETGALFRLTRNNNGIEFIYQNGTGKSFELSPDPDQPHEVARDQLQVFYTSVTRTPAEFARGFLLPQKETCEMGLLSWLFGKPKEARKGSVWLEGYGPEYRSKGEGGPSGSTGTNTPEEYGTGGGTWFRPRCKEAQKDATLSGYYNHEAYRENYETLRREYYESISHYAPEWQPLPQGDQAPAPVEIPQEAPIPWEVFVKSRS